MSDYERGDYNGDRYDGGQEDDDDDDEGDGGDDESDDDDLNHYAPLPPRLHSLSLWWYKRVPVTTQFCSDSLNL